MQYIKIKELEIPILIKSYKTSKSIKIYFKGNTLTITKPTRLSIKKILETIKLNEEDIYNKYVPMGYENFKIEGRSVPDINVLETYMYYMVKPEYRDRARLFLTLMLTRKHKYFND